MAATDDSFAPRSRDVSLDDAHTDGSASHIWTRFEGGAATRGVRSVKRCALSKGGLLLAVSLAVLGGGQAAEVSSAASEKCVVEGAGALSPRALYHPRSCLGAPDLLG